MLGWIPLAAAEPLVISYEEALRVARERNLAALRADAEVARAEGALLAARSPFDPTLTATGTWFSTTSESFGQFGQQYSEMKGWSGSASVSQATASGTSVALSAEAGSTGFLYRIPDLDLEFTEEDPQPFSAVGFSISQALLQGHRLAYNLQSLHAAERGVSVAQASARAARQKAMADAANAYWALHYARRTEAIARQTLAIQQEQQRVVHALVEAGRLAQVEVTRIDAAVAQAERAVLDAENASRQAEDVLLVALGEPPGQEVQLSTPPQPPPSLRLDEAKVVEAVLAGNPELEAARLAAEGAEDAAKQARHALLPSLAASVSGRLNGYEDTLAGSFGESFQGKLPEWSAGATLSVPLLNRADRGQARSAEADATASRLDLQSAELALAQEARAQVRTLLAARKGLDLAELNVRLAEETLAAERARLQEGRALQKDVIEAVKELDAARVAVERAIIDFQAAVVELERLKGAL